MEPQQAVHDAAPLMKEAEEQFYGSLESGMTQRLSRGHGGLLEETPTEGYCLVFEAVRDKYYIDLTGGKLAIRRNQDYSEAEWNENRWDDKVKEMTEDCADDLLKHFKTANIKYKILRSRDPMQKYVYVVITTDRHLAEDWADKHNIDIPIEPAEAVSIGRNFEDFYLAQRTILNDSEEKTEKAKDGQDLDRIPLDDWNYIHIAFEQTINEKVYKHDRAHPDTVVTHRMYLRILYEMLTDDLPLGGANFIVEKFLLDSSHPLVAFFALHQTRDNRPAVVTEKLFKCRTPQQNLDFCDHIRDYFGENIGFYFHFLVHYTKWLYPMALLGTVWFVVQLSVEDKYGIATPGSSIIVFIFIMWSTLMIENWYRREWKLRFKWGMMRYKQTEVPRPAFSGRMVISKENGEIIETYQSWFAYVCKITFSMSTMVLCIAIVMAVVAALFILRGEQNDEYLSIGVGMLNSIQIFIMNKIYTWLAYRLNEWEGHRLQQDYYNNLVVKRIIFIVFNSFYSLFYIAFFDDTYTGNDRARLAAIRTQLLTLFIMALVLQNSMELLFPWLASKIKKMCMAREEEEWQENTSSNRPSYQTDALLSDEDDANRAQVQQNIVGGGDDNIDLKIVGQHSINNDKSVQAHHTIRIDNLVMEDIEEQVDLGPSPDVLDNTAEIVILQGYIMLFVIIFPLMPALAAINNYFELRIDFYNLLNSRRPVPGSAAGLGVWKSVLSSFNIIAVFSNLAIITFRTDLIKSLFSDEVGVEGSERNLWIFYFSVVLALLFIIFVIRVAVEDVPTTVSEAISRQEACERHLLMAPVKAAASKAIASARKQKKLSIDNGAHQAANQDEDEQKHEL
eukprot:CAMPEP_0197037500 /NCGR_PEP_ID=MMETSP1384-20130603/14694_1 /TAXON_ID=29189 /ORGANISM="Ammonia sp." /LENGTH=845 /DNA_ID=CAMNT_0042467813 /DNA_START=23 /DNA_END=2560 /DNA_ORIENTATION=-